MICPSFETLHKDEHRFHLKGCEACRSLAAMRELERPNAAACETVDGLMGLVDSLTPPDSKLLHDHLSECPACMVAYLTLVADADADALALEASPPWKGPSMEQARPPRMIRTRTAVIGGVAFAAAAVLAFYAFRQSQESKGEVATTVTELETAPGASRPAPTPSPPPKTSTNAPAPASRSFDNPRITELAALSDQALKDGKLDDAITNCSESMGIDPLSEGTSFICALAYCTAVPDTESSFRLTQRIASIDLRRDAERMCDEALSNERECDEVVCLVDPNLACCTDPDGPMNPETQEARRAEYERVGKTRGEKMSLIVASLVEQAREATRDARYAGGLSLVQTAIAFEPGNQDARLVGAIAACNLGDAKIAKSHIDAITGESKRASVTQICIREGVQL